MYPVFLAKSSPVFKMKPTPIPPAPQRGGQAPASQTQITRLRQLPSKHAILVVARQRGTHELFAPSGAPLLDGHRLGQVAREVHVETLEDGQPVGNELKRNDVEKALQAVDRLGHFDLGGVRRLELLVAGVADDNGLATTSNNYKTVLATMRAIGVMMMSATYLAGRR